MFKRSNRAYRHGRRGFCRRWLCRRGLCRHCQRKAAEKRLFFLDALLKALRDEFYRYLVKRLQEAGSFAATAA
nr:hypothetical protein Itr_chr03CG19870 [Ipomoea trifida]GMC70427.1 hypothetical protein Iba_chr03aCG15790 [Ipomoea batatas]